MPRNDDILPAAAQSAELENVLAFGEASSRQSHTTASGELRIEPIDGVVLRRTCPVSHQHGHLTEAYRTDWNIIDVPLVQVTATSTFPGRIRAWGLHRSTTDRLFCATGSLCVVCFDGRKNSPTFGRINEFFLGERNQGLVVIPPGIYHGWINVGSTEAMIIGMPSQLYNHDNPDRFELMWDSEDARKFIRYDWFGMHQTAEARQIR